MASSRTLREHRYMQAYGVPAADILIWPVALVEVLAGLALVLGWKPAGQRWR